MKTGVILLPALVLALAGIPCPAQSTIVPYTFTTIAGELEIDFLGGYADGTNGQAQFNRPEGVALDSAGNLYVADMLNQVIRKITPVETNWVVKTLAGQPGNADWMDASTGSGALFNAPRGVAVDDAGNVYVADTGNNAIRLVKPSGTVTTLAGNPLLTSSGQKVGGYLDGIGTSALFNYPTSVAVDKAGNLYVADNKNNVIRKMTKSGSLDIWEVSTFAGSAATTGIGSHDGKGSEAQFNSPFGVAVDHSGNLYVADTLNNEIRKVTPAGLVSTLAGLAPTPEQISNYASGVAFPNQDGTGNKASFFCPRGLAVDSTMNVYVADTYNSEIRKVTSEGVVTTLGGLASFEKNTFPAWPTNGFNNGTGSDARFSVPVGVAVDGEGNLYVGDTDNCVIRKGVAPVVQLVALEVTQVIQDWSKSIPLVAGKDTYVRAHLYLPPVNSGPVTVSGATLMGSGPLGPLPNSPICPIQPNVSLTVRNVYLSDPAVREEFNNSLNFRLPPEWLNGSITLQLAWGGNVAPVNAVPNDGKVPVTFVPVAVPQVKFFAINWTNSDGELQQVGPNLADLPRRLLSCYPVASVDSTFETMTLSSSDQPTVTSVNRMIGLLRVMDVVFGPSTGLIVGNRIYHGAVAEKGDGSPVELAGLADVPIPSFVSSALVPRDPYKVSLIGGHRHSAQHEIGHNLGAPHDVSSSLFNTRNIGTTICANGRCGEWWPGTSYVYPLFQEVDPSGDSPLAPALGPIETGFNSLIYGLDTLTLNNVPAMNPVLSPYKYFDLMSYCFVSPLDRWPSSFTYTNLLGNINKMFGASHSMAHAGPEPRGGAGAGNILIVRGTMDFNARTAHFLPCLALTSVNAPPAPLSGTNFSLQALDGSGVVLQSVQFSLEPGIVEDSDTSQTADFIVPLTDTPPIHTLQLWYDGAMLATLTASPHAPTVTLASPNGGQNFATGPVSVAWSGNDADGDSLTYIVQYSADDGATWKTLVADWSGHNFQIDSQELTATTNGLMRVIASDGFNTSTAQSAATFIVQPHAPAVSINSPAEGSIFIGNQQLFLDARAFDMQDGELSGTNVQWHSDLDGALGTGAIVTFNAQGLSEGHHTITVTAIDSAGLKNSAVTHLLELHYSPPHLNLQVTPGTMLLGRWYPPYGTFSWPSYYTNYVLQASASLSSGWAIITNTAPEVAGNQQTMSVGLNPQTSFFRLMLRP